MERGLLSEAGFAEWAKAYVLLCHIDTGLAGMKDPGLTAEKKAFGLHSFMFMDAAGTVLDRYTGPFKVEDLARGARRAEAFLELRKRAAAGDEDSIVDLALRRVALFHLKADEARRELDQAPISAARREVGRMFLDLQERRLSVGEVRRRLDRLEVPASRRAELEPGLVDAEVDEILRSISNEPGAREAAARKLLEMEKAGRVPATREVFWRFWMLLLNHAEAGKDAELLDRSIRSLDSYRKAYWDIQGARDFFAEKEKALDQIRKADRKP